MLIKALVIPSLCLCTCPKIKNQKNKNKWLHDAIKQKKLATIKSTQFPSPNECRCFIGPPIDSMLYYEELQSNCIIIVKNTTLVKFVGEC